MFYARTKQIGSYQVVTGFDSPSLDPVESAKIVDPLLEQTDEYKLQMELSAQFGELERQRQNILAAARQLIGNPAELEKAEAAYMAVVEQQKEIQQKALDNRPRLAERHLQLLKEHGVRFGIRGVEEIDEQTRDMLTSKFVELNPHERLLLDGTVISDYIGQEYCIKDETGKWIEVTITELGHDIPEGAVQWGQFSRVQAAEYEEQKDLERIAALSPEEKAQEKEILLENALIAAGTRRREYEIQDRMDPLADAQQWYQNKCAWIENRYQ